MLLSYVVTRLAGLEGVDVLGVATSIIELGCLALLVRRPSTSAKIVSA